MAKVGGYGKHDISFKAKNQAYKYYAGLADTYKHDEEHKEKIKIYKDAEPTPPSSPEKMREHDEAKTTDKDALRTKK